jgi:O-antigen/teichoic acid export membrane protein
MNGVRTAESSVDNEPAVVTKPRNRFLSDGLLSLVDQGIVSGTNFAITVIIGRESGETQLGLYSLGFTIVVLNLGAQESLITLPYTVYRPLKEKAELAGLRAAVAIHQVGFSLLISLLLLVSSGILWLFSQDPGFARVLLVLAATATLLSARDFIRRIAFADFQIRKAIKLDILVCSLQLIGILALAKAAMLTAVSAHALLGLACGIVIVTLLSINRSRFAVDFLQAGRLVGKHWRFGRWVLAGQLVGISNGYLMHWLLAIMLGAAEAGIFAACMSLVYFTNPIVIGVGNYLTPSFSSVAAGRGIEFLRRPVFSATALLALSLSLIFFPILFFGDQLLVLLFGDNYAGYGRVTSIVAFGILFRAIGVPPENGLRAMNRPEASSASQMITLAVSLVSALIFIPKFGLVGAGSCLMGGYVAGNLVRWFFFLSYSKSAAKT